MLPSARNKLKLQREIKVLNDKHGRGRCWVCGSTHGLKMSRAATGVRCNQCIREGKTTGDVQAYEMARDTFQLIGSK